MNPLKFKNIKQFGKHPFTDRFVPFDNIKSFYLNSIEKGKKALQQYEEHFCDFFESTQDCVKILEVNSMLFVGFNQNALRLIGFTEEVMFIRGPLSISPEYQHDGRRSEKKADGFIHSALNGNKTAFEWLIINSKRKKV
jgi:hypothetical protein